MLPVAVAETRDMASRLLLLTANACTPATTGLGVRDEEHLCRYTAERLLHRQARFLVQHGLKLLHVPILPELLSSDTGKPFLSLPGISLSLSYTHKPYCLLCQTDSGMAPAIGLDCLSLRADFLPPARFFSAAEQDILARLAPLSPMALGRELLRRLCIYEAVLKAHGTGLACVPTDLDAGKIWKRLGNARAWGKDYAWRLLTLEHTYVCLAVEKEHEAALRKAEVRTAS